MDTQKKAEYLVELLTELNQPHMVFDDKIFVIPTSSPMFELLPCSPNKVFEADIYTILVIDLKTYEINKREDNVEYILHWADKI